MNARVAALLTALVAGAVGLAQAAKQPEWVELRSPHFHIISDAKPKRVAQLAQQLEDFRQLMGLMFRGLQLDPPEPTRVIFFKNEKGFRPYAPLTPEGKAKKLSGFMQPGRERMYLVVHLGGTEVLETTFHEYVHLLLHLSLDHLPLWLEEGLAQYYERTEINGDRFSFALPKENAWAYLQRGGLIPLQTLLEVDYRSEYYNVLHKQRKFYAQSWLLVHYLMVGEKEAPRHRMSKFVLLLRRGLAQQDAFQQAFEMDYAEAERRLRDYLSRYAVTAFRGHFPQPLERLSLEPQPLSPVVAQASLTDLWLNSGRVEEVEKALAELAEAGRAEPEVLFRLGRLALIRQRPEEAEKYLRAALETQPSDISLRYYAAWAVSQGRLTRAVEPEERRAAATEIIELLSPVLTQSDFPDAIYLLVQARLTRDDPPSELIPVLERARELAPQRRDFDMLLAQSFLREKRWDDAEKLLQDVVRQSPNPDERQLAEAWLKRARAAREYAARSPASEPEVRPLAGPRDSAGPPPGPAPVEPPPAPAPAAPPKVAYLRGTLVNVACADDAAVVTVRQESKKGAGKVFHLAVRSLSRVIVIDPTRSGEKLACGPSGIQVAINYRVEPQGPTIAGVVMTIELHPPAR